MDETYKSFFNDVCTSCGIKHIAKKVIHLYQSSQIFAIDLMFYMCREYDIKWQPKQNLYYEHYSMTHFTALVREAVKILIRNHEYQFLKIYSTFSFNNFEDYSCQFLKNIASFINGCIDDTFGDILMRIIIFIARVAVEMHRKKMYFDLNIAVKVIKTLLDRYSLKHCPSILTKLNELASSLIQSHLGIVKIYISQEINEKCA